MMILSLVQRTSYCDNMLVNFVAAELKKEGGELHCTVYKNRQQCRELYFMIQIYAIIYDISINYKDAIIYVISIKYNIRQTSHTQD